MLVGIYALLSTLQAEADHGGVAQPVQVSVPNKAGISYILFPTIRWRGHLPPRPPSLAVPTNSGNSSRPLPPSLPVLPTLTYLYPLPRAEGDSAVGPTCLVLPTTSDNSYRLLLPPRWRKQFGQQLHTFTHFPTTYVNTFTHLPPSLPILGPVT